MSIHDLQRLEIESLESRIAPSLTPFGSEIQVNTRTLDRQWYPAIACDPDGDFTVAFGGYDDAAPLLGGGVLVRRFNFEGTAQGDQRQVTGNLPLYPTDTRVVTCPNGDFVVAWTKTTLSLSLFQ